jgi:hypothetical protein
MAGKPQVFLSLSDDLMQDRGGNAVCAKPADGDVVAILYHGFHCLFDRSNFVHHGTRFMPEKLPRFIGIRISKQLILALF